MKQRHIECLKRLFELSGCQQQLTDFMLHEKLMTEEDYKTALLEKDTVRELCNLLFIASKQEKIQLLQWEWHSLPVERIRLKIVTEMDSAEFAHNF